MLNVGVNVQPQTVLPGEWQQISAAYPAGILAIIDWQAAGDAIPTGQKIGLWRFTQDPRGLRNWPAMFAGICPWAVCANEPDLEGWPTWYVDAVTAWRAAGGKVVEPALHDERQYQSIDAVLAIDLARDDALSWHCYAGDWRNRDAVLARANGRPVFGTEYGIPNDQRRCLTDLAAAGATETVFLFDWRWQGNASAGYDLAGVTMEAPMIPAPAQPASVAGATIYQRQWKALGDIPLNPDAAIYKAWLDGRRRLAIFEYGIPTGPEQPYPEGGPGAVCQLFTGAVAIWTPAGGVEWR